MSLHNFAAILWWGIKATAETRLPLLTLPLDVKYFQTSLTLQNTKLKFISYFL